MERRTFKYEGQRNDHILHYEQVFGNVFKRKESKCCAVLMKHCRKLEGEQVKFQSVTDTDNEFTECKIQGKNSNQLAFHLSTYTQLRKL